MNKRLLANRRIERADDERAIGNGIIVTLRQGWTWDAFQDNRVRGFDTAAEAAKAVQSEAAPFAGPYTH